MTATAGAPGTPDPFAPVATTLRALNARAEPIRTVRIWRPWRIVAFSRRDERSASFAAATRAARAHGYQPAVRPVGGTFAPLHAGSLVVDEYGYTDLAQWPNERFDRHAALLASVFADLGLDARIGEVPGEYCPGAHSINRAGTQKISGTAQRVSRGAFLVSSVVQVRDASALRTITAVVADALGTAVDVDTIGALEDTLPRIEVGDVASAVTARFVEDGADRVEWAG